MAGWPGFFLATSKLNISHHLSIPNAEPVISLYLKYDDRNQLKSAKVSSI